MLTLVDEMAEMGAAGLYILGGGTFAQGRYIRNFEEER